MIKDIDRGFSIAILISNRQQYSYVLNQAVDQW